MVTGLAHVCFIVSNLDESIAFYEKLGLTPAFDYVHDNGERYGMYLHAGGRNFIELFVGEVAAPTERQSYRHVCLEVDDINATTARLRQTGVEIAEPKLGKDRSWQVWVTDPDGNRIELHQYTRESKQTPWLK